VDHERFGVGLGTGSVMVQTLCDKCKSIIAKAVDGIELTLYKREMFDFCSLKCLREWLSAES
jgi:hypothetical protein